MLCLRFYCSSLSSFIICMLADKAGFLFLDSRGHENKCPDEENLQRFYFFKGRINENNMLFKVCQNCAFHNEKAVVFP